MKGIIITTCLLFSYIILYATHPIVKNGDTVAKSSFSITPSMQQFTPKNIYQVSGIYIDASPGLSTIINNNISDIWNSENKLGYNLNVGYFRSLSSWMKVKLGIGFSSYSTNLTGSGEIQSSELKDIDNDTYIETLTLSNAVYKINPMYVSVPLIVEFGNPNLNKIGYYVDFGIEYSYMINEKNKVEGTFSTQGEYPQWGVTLSEIPELGFYSARNLDSQLNLQKSNYSVRGGAGITIPISGVVIFKIGLTGYLGLKDIGNKKNGNTDLGTLSQQTYEFRSKYINNPLAASSGSKTIYTGIEFGFYISKHVK
ncbi:MAG TPA: hypothetical protein VKA38_13435 [Draconibacterium sp.]|nr:hypothetical protein [Draconibacterium sp.]